jgi:endoglucanase
MNSIFDLMVKLGINAVRVPFSAEFALGMDTLRPTAINASANPTLATMTAGQVLDVFVDGCMKRNILVMPDMHRLEAKGGITELWYNDQYPESKVIDGWLKMVNRYKNHPHVFAADLKNEPHGACTWDGWSSAATRIGNAILQLNPKEDYINQI